MTAAVWTLIGVLAATLFGNLYWLSSEIDSTTNSLSARIDAGFARMDARFDALNARLGAHLRDHSSAG